jgi:hypothetical protein
MLLETTQTGGVSSGGTVSAVIAVVLRGHEHGHLPAARVDQIVGWLRRCMHAL